MLWGEFMITYAATLATCACCLHCWQGINWIYDINLTNRMRHIVCKHEMVWRSWHGPGREKVAERVKRVKSIREFDEAVTIHSFGEWDAVTA